MPFHPFDAEAMRQELQQRLNSFIANEETRQRFLDIMEWVFEEAGRRPNKYVKS